MIDWLPPPRDFPGDLRAALAVTDRSDRVKRLAALAQHRLGFLEMIQLDRALEMKGTEPIQGFTPVRLAILASATVDHLAPAIRVAGLRRGLLIEVYIGGYGQHRQELFDRASSLHTFRPELVLFALTAREATAGIPLTAGESEAEAQLQGSIGELQVLWREAREALGASVIQQTFLNVGDPLFGSFDRQVPGSPTRLVTRLNEGVAVAAQGDAVLLLDLARACERDGLDAWFDPGRWLQAKMEIKPQTSPIYGDLVARLIAAHRGLSKKCLVLDLDNTLWGGVIGDDGLDGIVLGEGSAAGEAHLALQRYTQLLGERGVILAVCSKNDRSIAEAAFENHPEMLLKRSDIAAFLANWDDKAVNLGRIAEQLNIGLDSMVFVDDNPAERARVRESLPMVAVPELPADPAQYVRCLADTGYFEAIAFTPEDRERRGHYAANASREALSQSTQSVDEFLRGLEMSVSFGPVTSVDLARVAQLINKTNQFNPTTHRHSIEDVTRFAASEMITTWQFRLRDRFGDNGLVSAMIIRQDTEQQDVWDVDTWVMSCRVFGRQLECEAMNIAVEALRGRGVTHLRADYIPTAKNGVVRDLYRDLGFTAAPPGPGTVGGSTRWILDVAKYVPRPTHIGRRID